MQKLTFQDGIPRLAVQIITTYGLAQVQRFHEDGSVDIYIGGGRVLTVPGSTPWKYVAWR